MKTIWAFSDNSGLVLEFFTSKDDVIKSVAISYSRIGKVEWNHNNIASINGVTIGSISEYPLHSEPNHL